ncbi:MAG: metal ABC transporter permease [Methylobacteriaceae bacterium]|nr:metal ABC transporter permease [Methylobacteriaceae bacterium]
MLFDLVIAPFADFGFMRRALVGAVALALSGAPIGVFLLLRRMSLMGDAMAHAILPGAALGYLVAGLSLGAMTLGGLLAGLVVVVLAGLVARWTTLREDASLAAFYLLSLALGVVLMSARGSSVDLMRVLFGSVLALDDATLLLLASVSSLTLLGLALLYRPLALETVDPGFLATVSRAGPIAHIGFLMLLALNLVAGFHALGTLLSVGLMILPAATARLWTRDVTAMIGVAMASGVAASVIGLLISYAQGWPTGPAIVLTAGVFYVLSLGFGRAGGLTRSRAPRRHLRA